MSDANHYEVLGIAPSATKAEAKAAYQAALTAAQESGDADTVSAVRRAWQVLSDPQQRQRYDDALGLGGRGGAPAGGTTAGEPMAADDAAAADTDLEAPPEELLGDPDVNLELRPGAPDRRDLPVGAPAYLEQPTLGRRLVATLIDGVTFVAAFAVSFSIAQAIFGWRKGDLLLAISIFYVFWALALYAVPTLRTGQTLGKRMTYIMVVDRPTGELLSPSQVIRRYLIPVVAVILGPTMGPFLGLIFGTSYAMARDQVSMPDRFAKSLVVIARYRPLRRR